MKKKKTDWEPPRIVDTQVRVPLEIEFPAKGYWGEETLSAVIAKIRGALEGELIGFDHVVVRELPRYPESGCEHGDDPVFIPRPVFEKLLVVAGLCAGFPAMAVSPEQIAANARGALGDLQELLDEEDDEQRRREEEEA